VKQRNASSAFTDCRSYAFFTESPEANDANCEARPGTAGLERRWRDRRLSEGCSAFPVSTNPFPIQRDVAASEPSVSPDRPPTNRNNVPYRSASRLRPVIVRSRHDNTAAQARAAVRRGNSYQLAVRTQLRCWPSCARCGRSGYRDMLASKPRPRAPASGMFDRVLRQANRRLTRRVFHRLASTTSDFAHIFAFDRRRPIPRRPDLRTRRCGAQTGRLR
jgi:hypothetical protein